MDTSYPRLRASTPSYRERRDAKLFAICVSCLLSVITVVFFLATNAIDGVGATALMIGAIVFVLVLFDTLTPDAEGLDISLSNLPGLYGFVFGVYYLTALVFYIFRDDVPHNNVIEISLLMLLGFIGFRTGIALSGTRSHPLRLPVFSYSQIWSLLVLSWIGFFCVLIGYLYLIAIGAFFTHGFSNFSGSTVGESLLQETTLPFQLPIVMITAMLSAKEPLRLQAKLSLWIFTIVLCGFNVLSGQFRTIISILVVVGAVLQVMSGLRLSLRRLFVTGLGCSIALFLIFSARIASKVGGSQTSGPLESIAMISEGVSSIASGSRGGVTNDVMRRSSQSLYLLSALIDRTEAGEDYAYGSVMLESFSSIVPHFLWEDKPTVVPPQRLIRRDFGLSDADDSSGPLIAYYAFGGPIGVLCWLFFFGLSVGWLQRWASGSNKVILWLLFFWILASATFIEADQTLTILMSARHCVVAWTLFAVIHFFSPRQ